MKITVKHKGDFSKTTNFLNKAKFNHNLHILNKYGQEGVDALRDATPKDTGLTANSWGYKIYATDSKVTMYWTNTNRVDGVLIAVILQYGHGTRYGKYVEGIDYINPALRPVFEDIANKLWGAIRDG